MISTIRKLIPTPVKRVIQQARGAISARCVRIFSSNRWLASLYYCLFSRRFGREHLAVLKERVEYYRALRDIDQTSPLLRRNVHRLEKGLIMRPRREVFAESFILETVRCFNKAKRRPGYSADELQWAGDVMDEYFTVVKETPKITKAHREYEQGSGKNLLDGPIEARAFKPYLKADCPANPVSFDQLETLFLRRRSVRWYEQKAVLTDVIQKVINAAALAPSACNRQPYRFIVANEQRLAARIAECAGGTKGFAQQLPALIVVVGDLSAYPHERDRHLIYIDASLASMQLMLAAETVGLSTCPINWPDVERSERKLQSILSLPEYERVVMLIAIGYGDPASGIPYSQKKKNSLITQECATE